MALEWLSSGLTGLSRPCIFLQLAAMQTAGEAPFCQGGTDKKRGDKIAPGLLSQLRNPAMLCLLRYHPHKIGAIQGSASSVVGRISYVAMPPPYYMLNSAPCQAVDYA